MAERFLMISYYAVPSGINPLSKNMNFKSAPYSNYICRHLS